ncbi:MAG TPA: hypothetical protein VLB12_07370 [Gemmatimonadales bacterium]|nr:hypothetical protein [Gemmatimonadales bacterium]
MAKWLRNRALWVCAPAAAIAPNATTAFAGYLIHADFSGMTRTLTFGSFVGAHCLDGRDHSHVLANLGAIYNRLMTRGSERHLPEPRVAAQHT